MILPSIGFLPGYAFLMFISKLLCLRAFFQVRGTWCDLRSLHELGECLAIILPNWVDGSHKLIFHLENCNAAVRFRHFKLDAVNAVLISVYTVGSVFGRLTFLKLAYYACPIALEHRKFLKFLLMSRSTNLSPYSQV